MGHSNFFSRRLVWVIILFCATFVLKLIFNVLVGNLHENPGSWTHMKSTLTRKLVWPMLIISMLISPPSLITSSFS